MALEAVLHGSIEVPHVPDDVVEIVREGGVGDLDILLRLLQQSFQGLPLVFDLMEGDELAQACGVFP